MEEYIKKSALVAEIERQISAIDNCPKITNTQISVLEGNKVVLTKLLSFLNTLEVKEVDLEMELNSYLEMVKATDEDIDFDNFAKHFFELGLKVQKGD